MNGKLPFGYRLCLLTSYAFVEAGNLGIDGVLVWPLWEANPLPHLPLALCVCSQLVKDPEWRRGGVVSTPRSPALVCCPKPLDKLTQGTQWGWEGRADEEGAQRDRPSAGAGPHPGRQPSCAWEGSQRLFWDSSCLVLWLEGDLFHL